MPTKESTEVHHSVFAQEIVAGLSTHPKRLSSKYFYDAKGSELFALIMRMPSYYLTNCEYEIFERYRGDLLEQFAPDGSSFQLVEFGAGDGLKTRLLLEHFLKAGADFRYLPIDISGDALRKLEMNLRMAYPTLNIQPIEADYFAALGQLQSEKRESREVILFLGSNIGNFTETQAIHFLGEMRSYLRKGDQVLIGFDLKKDPAVVLEAYNDKSGITSAFNLNLLRRINRELDGDFDLEQFIHWEVYDPLSGEAKSYIVSKTKQIVRLNALNRSFPFEAWEPIWTELSQKFDEKMIQHLAKESGFLVRDQFTDSKGYFVDSLFEAI